MICGRPSTLSGTASAAARETAPRIPLQPTAKRWPAVSPASEPIAKTKARRTAIEAAAIAATGQQQLADPGGGLVEGVDDARQLQAEQDEEGRSRGRR